MRSCKYLRDSLGLPGVQMGRQCAVDVAPIVCNEQLCLLMSRRSLVRL